MLYFYTIEITTKKIEIMKTINYLQDLITRNIMAGSLKKAKKNLIVLNELRKEEGLEPWSILLK